MQDSGSLDCEFDPSWLNMFVSLCKILDLHCFIDLSDKPEVVALHLALSKVLNKSMPFNIVRPLRYANDN